MKQINLNDNIYFKLTEKGKRLLNDPFFKASVHEAGNDLYCTQMWVFCGLFGPNMQIPGMDLEVETMVYF